MISCNIVELFGSRAFSLIKGLIVDRSSFDRIMAAGGCISVNISGNTFDANAIPMDKDGADKAMEAAACINCSVCSMLT